MARYGQYKPRGIPRINWNHPFATGLVFYGFDTGGGEYVDLVSSRKATYTARPNVRPSRYGQGFETTSQSASFPQDSRIQKAQVDGATQAFCYACAYMQTSTAGNFQSLFGRSANGGGSQPFWNWDFEINANNAGQNTVRASVNNNGTQSSSTNWTGNANNVYTTLLNNIYGGQQHFYAQGLPITSGASAAGQVNTNADIIMAGVGFLYWGAMWNKPIVDILQLHLDPYSFLIFPGDDTLVIRDTAATALSESATSTDVSSASGGSAPALDGSVTNNVSSSSTLTLTLTTTVVNDIIVVCVGTENTSANFAPIPVVSVTDTANLTFIRRASGANSSTSPSPQLEIWWARATSTLSSDVITITFLNTVDAAVGVAFGMSGAYFTSPYDGNTALGTVQAFNSAVNATQTISTTSTHTTLIACYAAMSNGQTSSGSLPTGYTQIGSTSKTGTNTMEINVGYKQVSAAQSSVATAMSATPSALQVYVVDAISGDTVSTSVTAGDVVQEVLLVETSNAKFGAVAQEVLLASTATLAFDAVVQEVLVAQFIPTKVVPGDRYRRIR